MIALTAKKWAAAALALILLFTFAACGGEKTPQTEASTGESTSGTTAETTLETTAETTVETTAETTVETTVETTAETTVETTAETTEETRGTTAPTQGNTGSYEIPELVGAVPESGKVSSDYFDDVVFVGDSVSLKLSYYEAALDVLGKAQFLTSGSLGSGNALWEVSDASVHPTYKGEKMLIEDAIAKMGAKKVYIMLGMNDIALYGVDKSTSNLLLLIDRIKEKSPDVVIYIQSMTPIVSTSQLLSDTGHNPKTIHAYNEFLLDVCKTRGYYFIDVASVMYDGNGYLRREYCSDPDNMGIHFTNAGCAAWVDYLYTHTAG